MWHSMHVFFETKFPLSYVLSVLRSITKEVVLELAGMFLMDGKAECSFEKNIVKLWPYLCFWLKLFLVGIYI